MRDRANITIAMKKEVGYLLSTGATKNVVHHDLDIYFQAHEYWNVNISKTVRDSAKMSLLGLLCRLILAIEQCNSHYSSTDLDLNIQGQKFKILISRKQ